MKLGDYIVEGADSQACVKILRTIPEIERIRQFWESCNTDGDLDAYLFSFNESPNVIRPHVIVRYRDGRPEAMLIGRLERSRVDVGISYFSSRMPLVPTLKVFYRGLLGSNTSIDIRQFVESIWDSLKLGEAIMAVFDGLDLSSDTYRYAKSIPRFLCADHISSPQLRRARTLLGGHASFLSSLSSNERYNQKRRAKKLSTDFGSRVRVDHFCGRADIARLMRDSEKVARVSYQRGLGVGYVSTPAMRRYLEFEADKGTLSGHILYLNDLPCAFWVGSLYKGFFSSKMLAHDPSYSSYAPGVYLVVKVLEGMQAELLPDEAVIVDFGLGLQRSDQYKARFSDVCWRESVVVMFAPRAIGVSLNILRTAVMLATRSIMAVLGKMNLRERIQRRFGYRAAARNIGLSRQ
jgi:hypothetical protein